MKTSELLNFYTLIKKKRQMDGFQCVAMKKRIDMLNAKMIKKTVKVKCRNIIEPNCPGTYKSKYGEKNHVYLYCDICGHAILIYELKNE